MLSRFKRITGWSYDNAGNLLNDGYHAYTFDAENKISKVDNVAAYIYDGDGRRVRKLVGENLRFVYDLGGNEIAEFDGATGAMKKEYVYGASGLLATIEPTALNGNGARYATSDNLGTPRVVTNSSAGVVSRHDYMPFGEELGSGMGGRTPGMGYSVADNLRQKFTQKERDNETGLDYFGARYYASTQGRFTSVDPLMASARSGNPQTWNRYSYVSNRPLSLVDPNGMDECTAQHPCHMASDEEAARSSPGQALITETVTVTTSEQLQLDAPNVVLGTTIEMRSIEPPAASAPRDWDPSCAACPGFIPEMSKRAVPMKQMVEVGAAIATAEIAAPVILIEAAGAGTATLGIEAASLDTAVVGSQVNTAAYVGQTGFNVLRVADYSWKGANIPWLSSIISSGQSAIILGGNLYTQQEVQYLQSAGHVWNAGGDKLIPH